MSEIDFISMVRSSIEYVENSSTLDDLDRSYREAIDLFRSNFGRKQFVLSRKFQFKLSSYRAVYKYYQRNKKKMEKQL